jgi:hypothetical protein
MTAHVIPYAAHIAVDAVRVGPIRLNRHSRETLFTAVALRNLGARMVELLRAVRSFTEEHEAGVADQLQQRVVIGRLSGERGRRVAHCIDNR